MNDLTPTPVDVPAPAHTIAWTPSRGFIDNISELHEAQLEGEVILDVDDRGMVQAVEGDTPLACTIRVDRILLEIRRAQQATAQILADLHDRQQGVDTDVAVEVATLKARVRRLEQGGDQ